MAAVYSTRFFAGQVTAASQVIYTVPAGNVCVVRSISVVITGSGATADLRVLPANAMLSRGVETSTQAFFLFDCRHVLNEGEQLEVVHGGTPGSYWVVSGYLLLAP